MKKTKYPITKILVIDEELNDWIIKESGKMQISQAAFIRMTLNNLKERVQYNEQKKEERLSR
jgi:hypothetical protein